MKKPKRTSARILLKYLAKSPYRFYAIGCRDVSFKEAEALLEIILTSKASDIFTKLKTLHLQND
jgi:hypothetical protein